MNEDQIFVKITHFKGVYLGQPVSENSQFRTTNLNKFVIKTKVRFMDFGRVLFQLRSAETVYWYLHHPAKYD